MEESFLKKGFPLELSALTPEEKYAFDNLIRRKQIVKKTVEKTIIVELTSLGEKIIASKSDLSTGYIDNLSHGMLKSGSWKQKKFRHYDITINVPAISGGKRHFERQAVEYIRSIWLDLGFTEMQGPKVQTAFWDLDALFVPQDHPAREMQDTFFIKDPAEGKLPPIWKKIKEVHENGADTKSKGWQSAWDPGIAKKNLMITHDTYLSAKVLSSIKKEDLPVKTFQVMRVFRNENLDYKHLFEFYQVGGIVVDENVNFRNLLGYLKIFFKKMGFLDVRLRPAFFPYTSPSCEVEVLHPVHKEWIELGGSGIFRPEVVKPLLGFDCPVLAWGLGLARTVSEYWKINDIRDLYKNDLKQLREIKSFIK